MRIDITPYHSNLDTFPLPAPLIPIPVQTRHVASLPTPKKTIISVLKATVKIIKFNFHSQIDNLYHKRYELAGSRFPLQFFAVAILPKPQLRYYSVAHFHPTNVA